VSKDPNYYLAEVTNLVKHRYCLSAPFISSGHLVSGASRIQCLADREVPTPAFS